MRSLTGGRGVDVVIGPVGDTVFDDAVRALAPLGRLVVLGFAGGEIPRVKTNRLLLRNVSVLGASRVEHLRTEPGALPRTARAIADMVAQGLRSPVTRRYPLEQGARLWPIWMPDACWAKLC